MDHTRTPLFDHMRLLDAVDLQAQQQVYTGRRRVEPKKTAERKPIGIHTWTTDSQLGHHIASSCCIRRKHLCRRCLHRLQLNYTPRCFLGDLGPVSSEKHSS